MKKQLVFILAGAIALGQFGCKNDPDPTTPTKTQLTAPSNPTAYSADTTSVGLKWTPSSNASLADFASYQITVKQGSSTIGSPVIVNKTDSTRVISGLAPGIYTFEILALATSSSTSYSNSNAVSVTWAPANRYKDDERVAAREIKVYETSSTGVSGIILSRPKVLSVLSPGAADSLLIDLYVQTDTLDNAKLNLRSAHLFRRSNLQRYPRITRFSSVQRNANSLDDPNVAPPDSTSYETSNNYSVQFDSTTSVTTGKILYFKANNGNYGRILVKRSATNKLTFGAGVDQYLSLEISYQTQAYNPYAKPVTSKTIKRSSN